MFRDAATPDDFAEVFQVPSWSEHLRQHSGRTTEADADWIGAAREFAAGPPRVRHLVAASGEPVAVAGVTNAENAEDPGPR
jgi:hypothetical protein